MRRVLLVAALLLFTTSAQAFDINAITFSTWTGPFKNDRCDTGCQGAARLKFTVDNGKLVSVQAWAKEDATLAKKPYSPTLPLTDLGALTPSQITYTPKGEMVLLYPKRVKFTFNAVDGVIRGEIDPREHPERANWKVVTFELRPTH